MRTLRKLSVLLDFCFVKLCIQWLLDSEKVKQETVVVFWGFFQYLCISGNGNIMYQLRLLYV